jgi:hypothetical protein
MRDEKSKKQTAIVIARSVSDEEIQRTSGAPRPLDRFAALAMTASLASAIQTPSKSSLDAMPTTEAKQ